MPSPRPPAASVARHHRRSRRTFAASAVCLAVMLVLLALQIEGRPLALAASLALVFGGTSWWSKGRVFLATGTVRIDRVAVAPTSQGPVVRIIGLGFLLLGLLTTFVGMIFLVFGVA